MKRILIVSIVISFLSSCLNHGEVDLVGKSYELRNPDPNICSDITIIEEFIDENTATVTFKLYGKTVRKVPSKYYYIDGKLRVGNGEEFQIFPYKDTLYFTQDSIIIFEAIPYK